MFDFLTIPSGDSDENSHANVAHNIIEHDALEEEIGQRSNDESKQSHVAHAADGGEIALGEIAKSGSYTKGSGRDEERFDDGNRIKNHKNRRQHGSIEHRKQCKHERCHGQ